MEGCCDLEVDVNGEETFLVEKRILTFYSGRLLKLFSKSVRGSRSIKVIFLDFPGGAESFELMSRFCYSGGRSPITPCNIYLLLRAAHFMEMSCSESGTRNLLELTEKSLEEMNNWTWDELLLVLKQSLNFPISGHLSYVPAKCLDSLVRRLTLVSEASPCPSACSKSSGISFSSDTRSSGSFKNSSSHATWWFEDFLIFEPGTVELIIKFMVSHKLDHYTISRFLFYYQKSKYLTVSSTEKSKVLDVVIDMLYGLDWSSISCKSLFGLLRVSISSSIGKDKRSKLENLISSQLHQATLDNLLVPSPSGSSHLYHVNMVLRLIKAFLSGTVCKLRLKQVASLVDLYISEIAPDPCLKGSKFLDLIMALPDSARDSHDDLYRAMDMYIEVHALSEEEKLKICSGLKSDKLSSESCIHLSQNLKFPSKITIRALVSRQIRLKYLPADSDEKELYTNLPRSPSDLGGTAKRYEAKEQILPYTGNFNQPADPKALRSHLQGMQLRVMELEEVCRNMENQMGKIKKSEVTSRRRKPKSLPKLCS